MVVFKKFRKKRVDLSLSPHDAIVRQPGLSDNSRIRAIWSYITRITFIVERQIKLLLFGYMPIVSVVGSKPKKNRHISAFTVF